jgi:GT2 family glycosyltransferase
MSPLLTIAIPTYQNYQQLTWCLESLIGNTEFPFKVIIINNDSDKQSQAYIESICDNIGFKSIEVLQPGTNLKWMGSINLALNKTDTPFFCMMNDDVVFLPESKIFWRALINHFNDSEVGAVGPSSNFVAGNQNLFNINLPIILETTLLIGFCLLTKTNLLKEIGGLDESLPGGDDLDLSIRLNKLGYKLVADRTAYLHHIGQQTGQRVHKNYWDSQDHQEAVVNAMIQKHGFILWHNCFQSKWDYIGTNKANSEGVPLLEEDWYKKHLDPLKGKKGLNLGCGAKGADYEAYGLDIARKGDQGAGGRKLTEAVLDTTADATNLPMQSDTVDYIMAPHILEHLLDPFSVLDEWKRVLKSSGVLLLTMPNHDLLPTMILDHTHVHAYNPTSAKNLIEKAGFFIEEIVENIHGTLAVKAIKKEND